MNIVSNNCLGGFIYRDILKCEYQNPFIWTSINHLELLDIIKNFNSINFSNMSIDRDGNGLSNNFITVIDDKYRIFNHHIQFSIKDNVPRNVGNNVYYNKPWEYIVEKYDKRLKRMNNKIDCVALYWPEAPEDYLKVLIKTCKEHNCKCLIITNKLKSEKYNSKDVKIIEFYTSEKSQWEIPLEKQCTKEILEFLNRE